MDQALAEMENESPDLARVAALLRDAMGLPLKAKPVDPNSPNQRVRDIIPN